MTTQDAREELARVLAIHLLYRTAGGTSTGSTWRCSCGATGLVNGTRDMAARAGRNHLADALLAAIPTPAQVVGGLPEDEAYREQAEATIADLRARVSHYEALVVSAKAQALTEARDDIKARIDAFRSLDADPQYMDALNDAWGLVSNRLRAALGGRDA